jgi:hypothetical protein
MSMRATITATSTSSLYEVTAATRIITDPGPKWEYTLRPVNLEYVSGDVKPQATSDPTLTGYNVWELNNTTTTWFGLAATAYAGLEFESVPVGAVVLASAPAGNMVDSTGDPDVTKSFWLLFQYPNQLSGNCT